MRYHGNILKLTPVGFLAMLAACQWVKPEPGAQGVALVKPQVVQDCTKLGESRVKVKSAIGPLDRGTKKVQDELLTLAKNEAVLIGADAIVAQGTPQEGKQSFALYRCFPDEDEE